VESFLLQFCPGSTPIRYNLIDCVSASRHVCRLSARRSFVITVSHERLEQSQWNIRGILNGRY